MRRVFPLPPALCLALAVPSVFSLRAEEFKQLPDWARPHAEAAAREQAPEDADAWVLLDRTEFAYTGDGEIRIHRFRLARILTEQGLDEAQYSRSSLGGSGGKVKQLKGWNLRPDGECTRLDSDTVLTVTGAGAMDAGSEVRTVAFLTRPMKGSLVAWESQETVTRVYGPADWIMVMESYPVRRWELAAAKKEGWFRNLKQVATFTEIRHFAPWIQPAVNVPGQQICVDRVPALPRDEQAVPSFWNELPRVEIRFLDPDLKDAPKGDTWDDMARYAQAMYAPLAVPQKAAAPGKDLRESLGNLQAWMSRELVYKQVYLTPQRGLVPESSANTFRKRYGDCKDLATFLLGEAQGLGLKGYPALARIVHGVLEADQPVSPYCFNHVIAAIKLDAPLGLAAEVETPQGRFLLVDATERHTPLGWLGTAHAGGRVMICTDKGALWVPVPESAILKPAADIRLEGQVDAEGQLSGTVRILETGDLMGLRSTCHERGASRLREHLLAQVLDLPATGTLEVLGQGDPLDLGKPFEVRFKIIHPKALHGTGGGEVSLETFGLPASPALIQKPGRPRRHSVQSSAMSLWSFKAEVKAPLKLRPILPESKVETPFRSGQWNASVDPAENGSLLRLAYRQERRPVTFAAGEREKGLAEWKKDRAAVRSLHADGLAFKLVP